MDAYLADILPRLVPLERGESGDQARRVSIDSVLSTPRMRYKKNSTTAH